MNNKTYKLIRAISTALISTLFVGIVTHEWIKAAIFFTILSFVMEFVCRPKTDK